MNDNDPVDELAAQFREIAPPANVREANRAAVRDALEASVARHWWQRTVTMPLPAALATAAALILSVSVQLFYPQRTEETSKPSAVVAPAGEGERGAAAFASADGPHFEYSETQSYLSGVGVVGRNIVYEIKE